MTVTIGRRELLAALGGAVVGHWRQKAASKTAFRLPVFAPAYVWP
jgi:hypothetical protein